MVSSAVEETLAAFVAGAAEPERLVIAVAAAYYGARGAGDRARWQSLIDVIERASPGIVELGSARAAPGFAVRLAERPFPNEHAAALRRAAAAVLAAGGASSTAPSALPVPPASVLGRLVRAVRRWFTASA